MRILNLGKIQTVPKLDEKKAIETGAQANYPLNKKYFTVTHKHYF